MRHTEVADKNLGQSSPERKVNLCPDNGRWKAITERGGKKNNRTKYGKSKPYPNHIQKAKKNAWIFRKNYQKKKPRGLLPIQEGTAKHFRQPDGVRQKREAEN